MTVGSSISLLLASLHVISYSRALWLMVIFLLIGTAQMIARCQKP